MATAYRALSVLVILSLLVWFSYSGNLTWGSPPSSPTPPGSPSSAYSLSRDGGGDDRPARSSRNVGVSTNDAGSGMSTKNTNVGSATSHFATGNEHSLHFSPQKASSSSSSSSSSALRNMDPADAERAARGIVALYITHAGFHGVNLIASNMHGWVQNLILPQKNLDIAIFFDTVNVSENVLVSKLKLTPLDIHQIIRKVRGGAVSDDDEDVALLRSHTVLRDLVNVIAQPSSGSQQQYPPPRTATMPTEMDLKQMRFYKFCSAKKFCVVLSLYGVEAKWPKFLQDPETRAEILGRKNWLRCGCPPYCPVKKIPAPYVQGTRWYTHDMFLEANGWIRRFYEYWIKLDVDITIFRPLPLNLVQHMYRTNKIFIHTGYTFNGGGCSNNLHRSITQWCQANNVTPVSAQEKWWQQDDTVYYSNFVVSSVAFHTAPLPLELARFLNEEVEEGFFKYRWTDQSLFHKVFGVFLGPKESDFGMDLSYLRWSKKSFKKHAVFYHSKKAKSRSDLAKRTQL